jgi:hypothetical protein
MYRWQRRDAKQQARKKRMPKDGRSVFELERIARERAIAVARKAKETISQDDLASPDE